MAETAIELGHEYMVLTDHSPRLTIANGLTAERLREQLDVVAALNAALHLRVTRKPVATGAVFRLARATGLTAYDASYLWIAAAYDAELVTLDRKLARAAERP